MGGVSFFVLICKENLLDTVELDLVLESLFFTFAYCRLILHVQVTCCALRKRVWVRVHVQIEQSPFSR